MGSEKATSLMRTYNSSASFLILIAGFAILKR